MDANIRKDMIVMTINGIMIDCSRLIEKHEYYYKLIDFMSEWHQNTLLFHFTDDHGCAIQLESLPGKARYGAFTVTEIKDLIAYASTKNIQVIPELETFGHTRFITDTPGYEHLYAGLKTEKVEFNAIDPLNPETFELMEKLVQEISGIFPSKYLHIGCDEVDLVDYCKSKGLDNHHKVWADYVNRIINLARKYGKKQQKMLSSYPFTIKKTFEC